MFHQFLHHSELKGNNLVDELVRAGTGWSDLLPGITQSIALITLEYRISAVSHVPRDIYLADHNGRAIDWKNAHRASCEQTKHKSLGKAVLTFQGR